MAAADDVLEIAIEELRRTYDKLCNDYDQNRVKTIAFLGGEITLLGFLYASGNLFFPRQIYGKIFYAIALGLLIVAVISFFRALRSSLWPVPTEFSEIERLNKIHKTKNSFLEYVKDEYLACVKQGIEIHQKKVSMLEFGAIELLTGGTILLLLKFFGG